MNVFEKVRGLDRLEPRQAHTRHRTGPGKHREKPQVQGSPVVVEVKEDSVNCIIDVKSMSKNVAINTKNMENYDIKSVDPDNLEGSCDLAENRVSNVMKESDNENTVKADLD